MEKFFFTITELSDIGQIESQIVIEMVEYGILNPEGKNKKDWKFDEEQLLKFRRALRLINSGLDLNVPGTAFALELIDELEKLRSEVSELQGQLKLLRIDFE